MENKEIVFKCGKCSIEFPVIEFDNVGSYTLDKSKLNNLDYLKEKIDMEITCCIDCGYPSLNSSLKEKVTEKTESCFNVKEYELEIWDIIALSFGQEELDINELKRVCKILNDLPEQQKKWIFNGDENNLEEK